MQRKILFAGIDGSGKSTCLDLLISRLESKYRIIKIGHCDPYIFFNGEKNMVVKFSIFNLMETLRPIFMKVRLYSIFLILNLLSKIMVAKYSEILNKSDIIMYETDILLHPAVYITYHLPSSKAIKASSRFRLTSKLFGSRNNSSILYLDTDPVVAVGRINKRETESGVEIESHENVADLTDLKNEFDNMLGVASDYGFEVCKINTNNKSLREVADEAQTWIEKLIPLPA